uniref:RNA-dependent RNA polymerase n=1 Tax=Fusarium odoratissimum mycovirus P2S TaxID=3140876 RepID=A0AAU7YVL2_9VIRU
MDRRSIATAVTSRLGAGEKVAAIISGLGNDNSYIPENLGQYSQFRRCLHDVVCRALLDSAHYKYEELTLESFGIQNLDKTMKRQKPDLFNVTENYIEIAEVTCTYAPESSVNEKCEKYSKFVDILRSNGYIVDFNVICMDLSDPEWPDKIPRISETFIELIEDMISALRVMHSTPKFAAIRKQEGGIYSVDRFQFKMEDKTLEELVWKATGVRLSSAMIRRKLNGVPRDSHQGYIDKIAQSIIDRPPTKRPTPNSAGMTPDVLIADFNKMKSTKPNTSKIPRILQLGAPVVLKYSPSTYDESILSLRQSGLTGGYIDYILTSLQVDCRLDDRLITLTLPQSVVDEEQKQGPGRKNYLRKNGIKSTRSEPTHIGLNDMHITMLDNFVEDIHRDVSQIDLPEIRIQDSEETGVHSSFLLESIEYEFRNDKSTAIALFYQRLANEIVINSMRRRKRNQYALGYTGFEGIYFLIAPGPQLRTENNVIFVKIISSHASLSSGFSAPWHATGNHWESDWLSVDTDRLKHWQRSRDRTIMCTLSNTERLVRPGTKLLQALKQEINCRNHSLLTLAYLENKQGTSTTNQTVRYMWMKSLGDKQFKGLMAKFPQRINSVLQSYIMQKSVASCIRICQTPLSDLVTTASLIRDEDTGNYDESTTGVANLMPRLFTNGPPVPISYNLNEIYWCMLYNKDRQNKTQDAMNILGKILKEEMKYDDEINYRRTDEQRVNYFLGTTSVLDDIEHIHSPNPESHYFSYRAVQAGVSLQDTHDENFGENGSWLNSLKLSNILNKNLSEFATFKASVKSICESVDPHDLNEVNKLGQRTKAIELVAEIVQNEQLQTASDVAMQFSGVNNINFEVVIQIFKKNQIGGVREIIILFIKARILFNIVEEIARLLSKSDRREILTKGRDKRLMMRADYEHICSSFPSGTPIQIIKESYDMTTWAQKFIPTIFIPLFEHHFTDFPGVRDLSHLIFLTHSNKRMEYPKALVEQWIKHPELKHDNAAIQKKKEKFLNDGEPWFVNHSNMCQGIPHYNSTVLALSCLSLRDALFQSCLKKLGVDQHIQWKTRVGSDDKGTIIGLDKSEKDSYYQYMLFGQCEHASERLHSMELSVKSASGHVMYELNSAFMANLETLSPTIKFAAASVDTIGTTSCTSFVNESYSRIRQMRENGCSSLTCSFAHSLNADHFYEIFDTRTNGENDLRDIMGVPMSKIPYDFGVYPTYDIDLQDIVGPEYWNYRILKANPESKPVKLLYTEINKREKEELFPNDSEALMKKDHFGINQGLVRQLSNMRRRLQANADQVEEYFVENPFIIIRGPETVEETKFSILSKLFTKGASEALRRTSPAIYIGRLSAFRTAKAWTSPFQNNESYNPDTNQIEHRELFINTTYREFLQNSLSLLDNKPPVNFSNFISVMYPQFRSYDVITSFVGKFGALKSSTKYYSQAVRTWTVNNFNYEYNTSLRNILETSFGRSQESSIEDVQEFKKMVGMRLASLADFKLECKQKGIRPLDMFYYMSKMYKNSKSSRIQAFASGPSTSGLHMTASVLKKYNHSPGMTVMLDVGIDEFDIQNETTLTRKLDSVKLYYNLILMSYSGNMTGDVQNFDLVMSNGSLLSEECKTIVRSIRSLSGFDYSTKKALRFLACELLEPPELREKLLTWKVSNYSYVKSQRNNRTRAGKSQWVGELEMLVNSTEDCYTLHEANGHRFIKCKQINDLPELYRSLREMCRVTGFELGTLFRNSPMRKNDIYLSPSTKTLHRSGVEGVNGMKLNVIFTPTFRYRRLVDMQGFRIKRSHDPKTFKLEYYLEDNGVRSATICHTNGEYYPVEIPACRVNGLNVKYLGVSVSRLFENRSWFFNYRLPMMTESNRMNFLTTDVDYSTVLRLESSDKKRIQEYIEVREEVNEESFAIMRNDGIRVLSQVDQEMIDAGASFDDLFRSAIESITMPTELTQHNDILEDWADDVEASVQQNDATLESLAKDEGNIELVNAIGYKKRMPRKAMMTINGLQQGSFMKSRVLDCFFTSQNVRNERTSQLANMIIWVSSMREGENDFTKGEFELLKTSLINHLLKSLEVNTGVKPAKMLQIINASNSYAMPIQTLYNLTTDKPIQSTDLLRSILEEEEEEQSYGEEEDSDLSE